MRNLVVVVVCDVHTTKIGSLWRIRSSTMLHMVVVCPIISMAVAFLGRIRLGPKTKARFCTCIKFVSLYVATRPVHRGPQ